MFLAAAVFPAFAPHSSPRPAVVRSRVPLAPRRTPCASATDEQPPTPTPTPPAQQAEPKLTKVGIKSYYEGFFTQPVDASVTEERGDGTEQAIKFAASGTAVIAVLFLGFMVSNGLL